MMTDEQKIERANAEKLRQQAQIEHNKKMVSDGYDWCNDRQEWFKLSSEETDNEQCRRIAEEMGSPY